MIKDLIEWSKSNYSHLPWRENRSLYRTLVSEIMLQQTTVSTVIKHFERFLTVYPDIKSLANSSEEELLINWKGLGYYRRARNLHKAAIYFIENYNGSIPLDYDELVKAPGIGDYTANAILAMGADKEALCVDANLERVLARLYRVEVDKGPKLIKEIHSRFKKGELAQDIKEVSSRHYNEALMDLGRVYCQANRADCMLCPLSKKCKSFGSIDVLTIPIKKEKKIPKYLDLKLLRCFVFKDNKILAYKKKSNEWLEGQWECVTLIVHSEDESLKQYPKIKKSFNYNLLPMIKTGITKYRIENYVLACSETELSHMAETHKYEYREINKNSNFSTGTIKSLNLI